MNSFVSTGTTHSPAVDPVQNNGFWPDIAPGDFRECHRLDGSITPIRIEHALLAAIATVNRTLRAWQARQVDAGNASVNDVPVPIWQTPGVYQGLYLRAIYSMAHASLIEHYIDYDTTHSGQENADIHTDTAGSYRRDAAWAISEIEGRPHCTIELI